jgi:CubicO group peptidase (beta-lactamase class C family)
VISAADVDRAAIQAAVERQAARVTPGIDDLERYCRQQMQDPTHRELLGPVRPATGASGLIVHQGRTVARWGRTDAVEMCFSLTKALLSAVAGLSFELEVLHDVRTPVSRSVDHPAFATPRGREITWEHLLQQTSGWDGELWGIPAAADGQSAAAGARQTTEPPGTVWAYNDVRVNLLCLALTLLWRRPLDDVLRTELMRPLGAGDSWSWHGYPKAVVPIDGRDVPVVSGGAHWGGGLWASADDLARVGQLYLRGGLWHGRPVLDRDWIEASWTPSAANPDYGYLWWLNDRGRAFPSAPRTGRAGRGNLGRHLLWVDPARDLVVVSRWGEGVDALLWEVSEAIPARSTGDAHDHG